MFLFFLFLRHKSRHLFLTTMQQKLLKVFLYLKHGKHYKKAFGFCDYFGFGSIRFNENVP